MFRMGLVHTRDNGLGVSGAEPERTSRNRDLLYARTGIAYRISNRNRPRTCAYLAGINKRSGVPVHPMIPWWPPDDPSSMWPRVTRYDHHKRETIQDPLVSPKPRASCLIYILLYNYQFMKIAGAGHDQEFRSA